MTDFLLEINTKGIKDIKLVGSIKSVVIYLNEHLENHYLEYNKNMMIRYTRLRHKLSKYKNDEIVEIFIKNTIVKITKMEKLVNYEGSIKESEKLEMMR
jgi:hypothetical protein